MDLNDDGMLDVLSGSYSRMESDMAGLFQVLWGHEDGGFSKAQALQGSDGEPLIIPATEEQITDKICTRAAAVDFDGDGDLDLVSGNFTGTFYWFEGDGDGHFAPQGTWLMGANGPLRVDAHSDPVFADWDGDGDLDLLSGSSGGGAFLFVNEGSRTDPRFGARQTLLEPIGHNYGAPTTFGDDHVNGPQSSTRLYVDDLNADGKLDLLIGDSVTLHLLADGKTEAEAHAAMSLHQTTTQAMYDDYPLREVGPDGPTAEQQAAMDAWQKKMDEVTATRDETVRVVSTGFVWAVHQL